MRNLTVIISFLLAVAPFLVGSGTVRAFSFSEEEQKEAQAQADRSAAASEQVDRLLSIPCRKGLKKKKIAVVIGERHRGPQASGRVVVLQTERYRGKHRATAALSAQAQSGVPADHGMLVGEINRRLRDIGLKTYSEAEIAAQIAQAEMAAFLNNDMDAAASAASRLGANFFLRGVIDSQSRVNPVLGINEVLVSMAFTLVDASGRIISNVTARGDAYAGQDTLTVALDLIREQADLVVARLYHDYCTAKAR
jgi:hypothetical protein